MEINLEGIGPVFFERSNKAKNINISIKSSNQIRVAVPIGVSFEKAEEIARSKTPWIKKNLAKISSRISLKEQFKSIDQGFAKTYLIQRLIYLANHYEFNYNQVTIRNQKTRWGSCSSKNNIKQPNVLPPRGGVWAWRASARALWRGIGRYSFPGSGPCLPGVPGRSGGRRRRRRRVRGRSPSRRS